jgi:hypothetical protein
VLNIGAASESEPAIFGQFMASAVNPGQVNDALAMAVDIPPVLPAEGYSGNAVNDEAATTEPGESWNPSLEHERSLWWRWSPAVSGVYVITPSSAYAQSDARFSIRQGPNPLARERALLTWGGQHYFSGTVPRTIFRAVAGTEYWIRASDNLAGFSWSLQPWAASNDDLASAMQLGLAPSKGESSLEKEVRFGPASFESWEVTGGNSLNRGSLWWSWTAPEAGLYRLTFRDAEIVLDKAKGEPIYLILAMTPDLKLRMKPQNLVVGLPLAHLEAVS